jgi:hypothetical protein
MKKSAGTLRLPSPDESIGPVTILDGQGRVVRVVPASEFRRAQPDTGGWRDLRRARPLNQRRSTPAADAPELTPR